MGHMQQTHDQRKYIRREIAAPNLETQLYPHALPVKSKQKQSRMSSEFEDRINKACETLSRESKALYLSDHIAEVKDFISPFTFYRDYVSKNLPLIIRGGAGQWPAVAKWSISYFRQTISNKMVSVAVTPNGYADAIATKSSENGTRFEEYFVMPEERLMKMSTFLDTLENPQESRVFYIQKQNSNFKEEFPELWSDAVIDVSWASKAFGKQPDAVNMWMGDSRAITSMHKDPYENIYCVISGKKEFILHPPTDLPWIPYKNYPSATFEESKSGKWNIRPTIHEGLQNDASLENDENSENSHDVPWICIDPLNADFTRYPRYKNVTTLRATLHDGDMLYLPSLWFHHVRQSHACIALNYWYDMEYDIKYAYYKALECLCQQFE